MVSFKKVALSDQRSEHKCLILSKYPGAKNPRDDCCIHVKVHNISTKNTRIEMGTNKILSINDKYGTIPQAIAV